MLPNQTILGIQSPIKSYARAAERRPLFRFSRLPAKNFSASNASASQGFQRKKHEQESTAGILWGRIYGYKEPAGRRGFRGKIGVAIKELKLTL